MTSTWDRRWMELARHVAEWSKDRSRKVGAVIVDGRNVAASLGWNGFPRGVDDNVDARHARPAKYLWTEHAERNAIYNAAAAGHPTLGCSMFLPWYPCADCARAIIQAGISTVVAVEPDWQDPTYAADFAVVREMFAEAGLRVRFLPGEAPVRT
jgi:dCMP deaminase